MKLSPDSAFTMNSPAFFKLAFVGLCALSSIALQAAEEFELTSGRRFPADSVKATATGFTTSVVEAGVLKTIDFTAKDVLRANLLQPKELAEARVLIANNKAEEALSLLTKVESGLLPFRAIPDSSWQRAVMLKMDALAMLGKRREATAVVPANISAELPPEAASLIKDFQQVVALPPKNVAEKIDVLRGMTQRTIDSWVAARIWLEIGNSLADQGKIEDALKAWLRVPVFFPAEQDLTVRGTILAARGMQQIKRPQDGAKLLKDYQLEQPASPFEETLKAEIAKLEPTLKKEPSAIVAPAAK